MSKNIKNMCRSIKTIRIISTIQYWILSHQLSCMIWYSLIGT